MITQDIKRKESQIAALQAELKDAKADLQEVGQQIDEVKPCPRSRTRAPPPSPHYIQLRVSLMLPHGYIRARIENRPSALRAPVPPLACRPTTPASLHGMRSGSEPSPTGIRCTLGSPRERPQVRAPRCEIACVGRSCVICARAPKAHLIYDATPPAGGFFSS